MLSTLGTVLTIGTIGTDVCLKTVSLTCSKAVDGVAYMMTNTYPGLEDVTSVLSEKDIGMKIKIIGTMISELQKEEEKHKELKDSVKLSIGSVSEVIERINTTLEEVKQLRKDHEELYFAGWRSIDCTKQVAALKLDSGLLESRLDLMIKVISTQHDIINDK